MKFFQRRVIYSQGTPLMIRWILFRCEAWGIFVHKFVKSDDARNLHDHPWPFVAWIIKGGYVEIHDHTTDGKIVHVDRFAGSILVRPAEWRHRVVLGLGKPSWSLVLVGRRSRQWGFFTEKGWCHWRRYNDQTGLCEEHDIHTDKGGE